MDERPPPARGTSAQLEPADSLAAEAASDGSTGEPAPRVLDSYVSPRTPRDLDARWAPRGGRALAGLAERYPSTRLKSLVLRALGLLALALAFDVTYGQALLYTGNQNTYLLHGLAGAGEGFLALDWQARTADPTPLTSALVSATVALADEKLLYLYHAALMGLYLVSLYGIGVTLFPLPERWKRVVYVAILFAVHAPSTTGFLRGDLPEGLEPAGNLRSVLSDGLAGQYAVGDTFQPSLFGVLLVLSLLLFLRGRLAWSFVAAGAAAAFHPTYFLAAAVLCAAYLARTFFTSRDAGRTLHLAGIAGASLVPTAVYVLVAFSPTSPEIQATANEIIARFRIPHHALPERWWSVDDLVRVGVVLVGLAAAWRTPLFPIFATAVACAVALTGVQLLTDSARLALLFPWRLSVFLVPLATAVFLAGILSVALRRLPRLGVWAPLVATALAAFLLVSVVVDGIERQGKRATGRATVDGRLVKRDAAPAMDFVKTDKEPGDTYLMPPSLFMFRIATGAPIYVDYKTHPYKDGEVLEWRERMRAAKRIYKGGSLDCSLLRKVSAGAHLNHVVTDDVEGRPCAFLREEHRARGYAVFALERGPAAD